MAIDMNTPPMAEGPWSSNESLIEYARQRRSSICEKLFTFGRVECNATSSTSSSSCPSASSSASTTPDSSLPATPLDELPPSTVKIAPANLGDGGDIGGQPHTSTGLEKKGSLSRVIRKIGSTIRKGSIRRRNPSARLEEVRLILEKAASDAEPADRSEERAADQCGDKLEDDVWSTLRLAGAFMQHLPNDSDTSLVAVHGSPTESERAFAVTPEARESLVRTLLARFPRLSVLGALDLLKKAVLFVPYVLLVGLAPLLFPTRLSSLAFAPGFGYASRPPTPFGVFAHHLKMLPLHVGSAVALLGCLALHNPSLALAVCLVLAAGTWWAWRDFKANADMSAPLGCDDRVSLYWLVKGVISGDLVCPMSDLDWVCEADEEVEEEVEEEECDPHEDVFETLKEADGSLDCTITVAGTGVTAHDSKMRIIVECVD